MSCTQLFKRARPALGTMLELSLEHVCEEAAHTCMTAAFAEAERLQRIFSRFDPESELSRINRALPGKWTTLSHELERVLALGARIERATRGAFRLMPSRTGVNPGYELGARSVRRLDGGSFDLGGIAKGAVADSVFELLASDPAVSALSVNAGGDLRARGSNSIELRVPTRCEERRYALSVKELQGDEMALATSSLIGRNTHVGLAAAHYPRALPAGPRDITTVSVLAKHLAVADALTKAVLFGERDASLEVELGVQTVLTFDDDGQAIAET